MQTSGVTEPPLAVLVVTCHRLFSGFVVREEGSVPAGF